MTTAKKKEISALDALLKADLTVTEDVNIPRLGTQITVKAITASEFKSVSLEAIDSRGQVDNTKLFIAVVAEAETTGLFRNAELMEKVGAMSPQECVEKTLLAGEIVTLAQIILEMSQFDTIKVAQEVKN